MKERRRHYFQELGKETINFITGPAKCFRKMKELTITNKDIFDLSGAVNQSLQQPVTL